MSNPMTIWDNSHLFNRCLPKAEYQYAKEDQEVILENIFACLHEIENQDDVVAGNIVNRAIRLFDNFLKQKFNFSCDAKARIFEVFYSLVFKKQLSIVLKTKLLEKLSVILKNKSDRIDVLVDIRMVWEQLMDHVLSRKRYEDNSSDSILNAYVKKLGVFLYECKKYCVLDRDLSVISSFLSDAHNLLQNIQNDSCFQGLLLIYFCLPENYPDVAAMIPSWINSWASIQRNIYWDYLWLKIFCRIRKTAVEFDWKQLKGMLFSKSREYLTVSEFSGNNQNFPMVFPSFFKVIIPANSTDLNGSIQQKLSKLIYFLIMKEQDALQQPNGVLKNYPANTCTPIQFPSIIATIDQEEIICPPMPLVEGYNCPMMSNDISDTVTELCQFLEMNRYFAHPSCADVNSTISLSYFITNIVGQSIRHASYQSRKRELQALGYEIQPHLFDMRLSIDAMKYLHGFICGFALELLFGRHRTTATTATFLIRNLCQFNPKLVDFFVPHLLAVLGSNSITQGHLVGPSMTSLEYLIHNMLFPFPVLIKYLPDLLKLCLPGIDANDSKKTTKSLTLISRIFSFLPSRASYASLVESYRHVDVGQGSYWELMRTQKAESPVQVELDYEGLLDDFDRYSAYLNEFFPQFWERIALLLKAYEPPRIKSKNSKVYLPTQVTECFHFMFLSMDERDSSFLPVFETILIDFLAKCTSYKAEKLVSHIVETFVAKFPQAVPKLLNVLIDNALENIEMSPEKTSFRLRVISGICRRCSSEILLNNNVAEKLTVFFNEKFLNHKEKSIRKGSMHLLKDLLRGLVAVFPFGKSPCPFFEESNLCGIPGHPFNKIASNKFPNSMFEWHIPTSTSLNLACDIGRKVIQNNLDKLWNISSIDLSDGKKLDEQLACSFKILQKTLRGIADVLGDQPLPSNTTLVGDEKIPPVILTIQASLTHHFSDENKDFITNIRSQVLEALQAFMKNCFLYSNNNDNNGTGSQSQFQGFYNNEIIVRSWLKLFAVVILMRTCFSSRVNDALMFEVGLCPIQSPTVLVTKKLLRRDNLLSKSNDQSLSSYIHYWMGYGESVLQFEYTIWKHHLQRAYSFSFSSLNRGLWYSRFHPTDNTIQFNKTVECFYLSNILCGNEFDSIRAYAWSFFNDICPNFGLILNDVITNILNALRNRMDFRYVKAGICDESEVDRFISEQTQAQVFSSSMGCLSTILCGSLMKRIQGQWDLVQHLLEAFSKFDRVEALVVDAEKKNILSQTLLQAFSSYSKTFSHIPLNHAQLEDNRIFAMIFDWNSVDLSNIKNFSIRQSSMLCYSVLHLIGSPDIPVPVEVWKFVVDGISVSRGMPSLNILLGALFRLVYRIHRYDAVQLLWNEQSMYQSSKGARPLSWLISPEVCNYVRSLFLLKGLEGIYHCKLESWRLLFESMVYSGEFEDDSSSTNSPKSARWSAGIETIIRSALSLSFCLPRLSVGVFPFSIFSIERATSIYCLLTSKILVDNSSPSFFTADFVKNVLSVTNEMISRSQNEEQLINCTKAEWFCGIYRSFLYMRRQAGEKEINNNIRWVEIEQVLYDYFIQNTLNCSKEYGMHWSGSLYVAYLDEIFELKTNTMLMDSLLKQLKNILMSNATKYSSRHASESSSDEGSLKQVFVLTCVTAIASAYRPEILQPNHLDRCSFITELGQSLNDITFTSLISPYQAVRDAFGKLFALLSGLAPFSSILSAAITHLSSLLYAEVLVVEKKLLDQEISSQSDEMVNATEMMESLKVDFKHVVELSQMWMFYFTDNFTSSADSSSDREPYEWILNLLPVLLLGTGGIDISLSRGCQITLLQFFYLFGDSSAPTSSRKVLIYSRVLEILSRFIKHQWWHCRSSVIIGLKILMAGRWEFLTMEDRKLCRDLVVDRMLEDNKSEIQQLSRIAVVAFLYHKSTTEMSTLAAAYKKNCEQLASRLKSKEYSRSDAIYWNTLLMTTCVIQRYPLDLPEFLPDLIGAYIKHSRSKVVQDIISQCIRDFRKTHQDRWDQFSTFFSSEQLDDLQGSGTSHYFA